MKCVVLHMDIRWIYNEQQHHHYQQRKQHQYQQQQKENCNKCFVEY